MPGKKKKKKEKQIIPGIGIGRVKSKGSRPKGTQKGHSVSVPLTELTREWEVKQRGIYYQGGRIVRHPRRRQHLLRRGGAKHPNTWLYERGIATTQLKDLKREIVKEILRVVVEKTLRRKGMKPSSGNYKIQEVTLSSLAHSQEGSTQKGILQLRGS